jgi:glutaredoxin
MRYWVWLLAFGSVFAFQQRAAIQDWLNPPAPIVVPAGFQAVLYATAWCPYCAKARKLLNARHIPYREYDIEKSAEGMAQYERLHGHGIPVLVIKDKVIHGFDAEQINAALESL